MKKSIIIISLLVVIISITGCSVTFGVNKRGERKEINEVISIDNINEIKISTAISKIKVESYDGDDIKVEGELSENGVELNIDKISDSIIIDEVGVDINMGMSMFGNNHDGSMSNINIYIPNKYTGDFSYEEGVGKSVLNNLNLDNVTIKGGTGKITCNNLKFNKLNVDAGVGTIKLYDLKQYGDVDITGGVGEIEAEFDSVAGNLKYVGGIGTAKFKIPSDSPVKFDTASGLGDCKIDAQTNGENKYNFSLSVGVGDVKVYN